MDEKRLSKQGITAMNDLGHSDVESYVRTLVSEGLGKQIEDAARSAGQSDDPDANAPVLEQVQPNNIRKAHGNGASS